jgi:ribosomal protein L37E
MNSLPRFLLNRKERKGCLNFDFCDLNDCYETLRPLRKKLCALCGKNRLNFDFCDLNDFYETLRKKLCALCGKNRLNRNLQN